MISTLLADISDGEEETMDMNVCICYSDESLIPLIDTIQEFINYERVSLSQMFYAIALQKAQQVFFIYLCKGDDESIVNSIIKMIETQTSIVNIYNHSSKSYVLRC